MTNPKFIHLNVHSDFSITDGLSKINILVKQSSLFKMPAIGITDCTNLYGLIKFLKYTKYYGIKPIIGVDVFLYSEIEKNKTNRLTLLAKNIDGYKNIIRLISLAYINKYSSNIGPTIKKNWLINLENNLIILSGGINGDIGKSFINGDYKKSLEHLNFYIKFFSKSFYLEISRLGKKYEENYLNFIFEIAQKYNIPVVATNEVRFLKQKDFEVYQTRIAINSGTTIEYQKKNINDYSNQQYLRTEEEMCNLFSDIPEALQNTVEIAKRCNVFLHMKEKYFLPKFNTGKINAKDFLTTKAKKGLEKRLTKIYLEKKNVKLKKENYYKRLYYELKVINKMGFSGYFLIVMEFINWAKKNNILVGPGRGSGAGSLVAYALNITDINPLEFNLIFERFLNKARLSMPDFDIDFCMEKRDLVIEHVTEFYGKQSVAQIITFGTMTAKSVIRDVGRVLGYNYRFVDRLSKLIPANLSINLKEFIKNEKELKKLYDSNEEINKLIKMSIKLEGTIRNIGKHAGGVVISPTKIIDFTPIYCDEHGKNIVTQFDKDDIEYTGLVKFDFLGLKTLTVIDHTIQMINKNKKKIDISKIPLNDKKSFLNLQKSETTAIFQLESYGIKNLIKRLKPDCFEDIIALIALFRPGPLQSGMVDNYINRKHGREEIFYPDKNWQHFLLKPILSSTYGIILYQEQVMQIAEVFAGYTSSEADILRIAIGKKKPNEMQLQRIKFEQGAKNLGIRSKLAIKIFDLVEKFAGYGFNKSHSTAYALISYQTLWLKTHYPEEFMSAAISADIDNLDKVVSLIYECRKLNIKILQPNINSSKYHFYVNQNNQIVYGLGAIKGIGKNTVNSIIQSRKFSGKFLNLSDLCSRDNLTGLNNRILENLIMSGALDCFTENRALLFQMLKKTLIISNQQKKLKLSKQIDLFKKPLINNDQYLNIKKWPHQLKLIKEFSTLGLYLNDHPINQYIIELEKYSKIIRIKNLFLSKVTNIKTAGLLLEHRILKFKQNIYKVKELLILQDNSKILEVILNKNIKEKYKNFLEKNRIIIVYGKKIKYKDTVKIIAIKISNMLQERKKYVEGLIIYINQKQNNILILLKIKKILDPYRKGFTTVYIFYQINLITVKLKFGKSWRVLLDENLINKLKLLLGEENIKLKYKNIS